MAGLSVEMVKTDSEGHARRYVEELPQLPDAIIIAGGDGTISETVTGLLRRNRGESCPVGILPVGRSNTLAKHLFGYTDTSNVKQVESLADATIAVVRGKINEQDVIKIEPIPTATVESSDSSQLKPIYAMATIHWGAFRDALTMRDKYWYTGPWRAYTAFLFNAFSDGLTWNCNAHLRYSPPCNGCSNCYVRPMATAGTNASGGSRRWWSGFTSSSAGQTKNGSPHMDYSKVQNVNCRETTERIVHPSEMIVELNPKRQPEEMPKLSVLMGKDDNTGIDFVRESWSRLRTDAFEPSLVMEVRSIEIDPERVYGDESEAFFSIDNEAYEVKPVRISVVPRAVRLYVN